MEIKVKNKKILAGTLKNITKNIMIISSVINQGLIHLQMVNNKAYKINKKVVNTNHTKPKHTTHLLNTNNSLQGLQATITKFQTVRMDIKVIINNSHLQLLIMMKPQEQLPRFYNKSINKITNERQCM